MFFFFFVRGLDTSYPFLVHLFQLTFLFFSFSDTYLHNCCRKENRTIPLLQDGACIVMELNLTSSDPSKRTLRFIVSGNKLKYYFSHVPSSVKFAVYSIILLSSFVFIFFSFILFPFPLLSVYL